MVTIEVTNRNIELGRQIENDARQVAFDLSDLITDFGEGTAELVHQRSKDIAPYSCTTEQDDSTLTWTLTDTDTAYAGDGLAEIRWHVGETLAKTVIYKTHIQKSITADTVIPEPLQSWYDAMVDYIDQLKVDADARLVDAVESARQSATSASGSAAGASDSADTAAAQATQASQSASNAAQSATAAQTSAQDAARDADRAEQAAATAGYMWVEIDGNGHLTYERTDAVDVDFELDDGHLIMEAV